MAHHLQQHWEKAQDLWQDSDTGTKVAVGAAGAAALALIGNLVFRRQERAKPDTFGLSGGGISRGKVKSEFDDYAAAYGKGPGDGITDRTRTTQLVDTFYNLVTDLYEWGWGQSFHFSPKLPGKNWAVSEGAHEARLAAILQLSPGKECLDVGCGVGGPMRTIASTSGARVTGITINQYQVDRGVYHNTRMGVTDLCKPTQGNFLEMPFADGTFDAAYAIEATCHANKLEDVYGEIARVLKPGGLFASYEWVATKVYDPHNADHVRIIDEINFGNGLPEMRTYKEAEEAGRVAGLQLLVSRDIAVASSVAGPWYGRLELLIRSGMIRVNSWLVWLVSRLHLAPKGLEEVHTMLVRVATSLTQGGQTGVFSPMHLLVFRKPEEGEASKEQQAGATKSEGAKENGKPAAKQNGKA